MSQYLTRQRKALLEYLHAHPDESFSARQIADALEAQDVSLSAVYRNLAALETQGMVCRAQKDGGHEVFYRFTQADACRQHLHLSCSQCGKTFHMDVPATDSLVRQVAQSADFQVDRSNTVLYGVCGACRNERETTE
ncbi:MAG: transcriptional repressor [Clostridia bacterium]|nr:transcriptional repressor [Clostridia bacterium]